MSRKRCMYCAGAGWTFLMNSWFPSDGFRRERCWVCKGTKRSDYVPSIEWVAAAARMRILAAKWKRKNMTAAPGGKR